MLAVVHDAEAVSQWMGFADARIASGTAATVTASDPDLHGRRDQPDRVMEVGRATARYGLARATSFRRPACLRALR